MQAITLCLVQSRHQRSKRWVVYENIKRLTDTSKLEQPPSKPFCLTALTALLVIERIGHV